MLTFTKGIGEKPVIEMLHNDRIWAVRDKLDIAAMKVLSTFTYYNNSFIS